MTKGTVIGLSNLFYAILTDDPISGGAATYGAPVRIAGAITANVNPNAAEGTLFADDGPYDTATTIGKIALELDVADLDLETQAALLGHTMAGGVLLRKRTDVPPWLAVGYKTLKSNGKYRYTWLAKGKFMLPQQNNSTQNGSITFQNPKITGSFVNRDCDDEWERHIDEDDVNYMSSMGDNWFNNPYGGNADTTPPTISSVAPADAATAVADNSSVVWTFSEALALSTINTANFLVFADANGVNVPGSLGVNAARTAVTFTPTNPFTTATKYRAVVTDGVTDLAGNALAVAHATSFTTA